MSKKIIITLLCVAILTNIYIYLNHKINLVLDSYKSKIENNNKVIQDLVNNGAEIVDNLHLVKSVGKHKLRLNELIKDEKTIVLKISENNCTDCNRKCIDLLQELCEQVKIPLVILVSDARSAMIVRKKYGDNCYLIQEKIKNGIMNSATFPLMFTLTNMNLGYGFIDVYKKDSSAIASYLNYLRIAEE